MHTTVPLIEARPASLVSGLRSIDVLDGPCSFSDDSLLSGAYPPLPLCRLDHHPEPILVWGASLVARLSALGSDSVIVVERHCDMSTALRMMLEYEHSRGGLNLAEQARLLQVLEDLGYPPEELGPADILRMVAPDGSFPAEARRLRTLPEALRDVVLSGSLDMKSAVSAATLDPEAARAIAARLPELSLSRSRQLVRGFVEICRRDQADAETARNQAREIAAASDPVEEVRRRRYPDLTRMAEGFRDLSRRLTGGTGGRLSLEAPENFEGDFLSLNIRFSDPSELRTGVEAALALAARTDSVQEACDYLA